MNRKQRRASLKQSSPASAGRAKPVGDPASQLFAQAVRCQQQNQLPEAARLYKRLLVLKPDHAEACNNLGCVLQMQGKLTEASARFAQSLTLMPQLLEQFNGVCATLVTVLPQIGEAMQRAAKAWPNRLTLDQLLGGGGLSAIASDPILLYVLQSVPVRNTSLEYVLTSLRAALLDAATDATKPIAESDLGFCCALARQCFINEYVFAVTPDEDAQVDRLTAALGTAIAAGARPAPMSLAAIAMYRPLHSLSFASSLLERSWPSTVEGVLTQQLREPQQELALRTSIPRLTPIDDDVSQRVRQQYEENPYPRWINVAGSVEPVTIDKHLRDMFPASALTPLANGEAPEILIAGCGTGWHAIATAQKYLGARLLAIDLSLSSLCYAKRKTQASLSDRIAYGQGDILKLNETGRSFDVIDVSGVLHHMADPLEGWRTLLRLLRPGGLMHLGLYSELGRRDVVAARTFIAERGYQSTPADIRRCRQDLLNTPLGSVSRFTDFFSTSECRDLLFHVQESRMTIPAIKTFIAENGLKFVGFEFGPAALQENRARFASAGWSMTDLDRWHALETQFPDTFSGMYHLWVQRG